MRLITDTNETTYLECGEADLLAFTSALNEELNGLTPAPDFERLGATEIQLRDLGTRLSLQMERAVPGLVVRVPVTVAELRSLLATLEDVLVRLPRSEWSMRLGPEELELADTRHQLAGLLRDRSA